MTLSDKSKIYIQYFLIFFFVLILIPPSFYHKPIPGLDTSWNIAIHLAYKYHLVFGKDFVFTYGPLGILHTRLPIAIPLLVYLIFDIYFLVTLFFVLRKIFKANFGPGIALFAFFSIVLAMYDSLDEWYFFFFLFYVFSFLKEPSSWVYILQAALLSIIGFYLKISLGIVGIIVFFAAITYAVARKKINIKSYLLAAATFIILLFLSAKLLNVHLGGYIHSSMEFINSYNDAMFNAIDAGYGIYIKIALSVISIIGVWILSNFVASLLKKKILKNLDELFIQSIIGFCIFILFKSGFVRAEGHSHVFFKGASLLTVFLYLYPSESIGKKFTAACCWIILAISFISVSTIPGSYHPYARLADFSFVPNKSGEIKRYFQQIFYYHHAVASSDSLDYRNNDLKKIIGNNTADIIPSEISKIYFNGLRYNPRPVVQSYAAYNRYLDSLNYKKYISPEGPDYVLFTLASIDTRYPFFDESKTKLALLNRYRIIGDVNGDLILKKKSNPPNLPDPKNIGSVNIKFGENVPINKGQDIQYAQFFVEYSLWGKIQRFFYQPPALMISFILENGETKTFRAIKPILADGVIINKYVVSTQEFQILLQSNGILSTNIKMIRIGPDEKHSGFKDDIRMVTMNYSFSDKTAAERVTDSVYIAALLNKYKPLPIDSTMLTPADIKLGIQNFKTHSQLIEISGWAFRENANNKKAIVRAILRSKDNTYELPTINEIREDLTVVFKRQDLLNTGFVSTVSKSQLEPGDYQVGVILFDSGSQKKWVSYIKDAHILVRSNYKIEKIPAIDSRSLNKNDMEYHIELTPEDEDQVIIDGWGFLKNADSKETKINILLRDGKSIYKINTDVIKRNDLVSYFKNPLAGYGGFSTLVAKNKLPAGTYVVGIEITKGQYHSLKFSDQTLKIDK